MVEIRLPLGQTTRRISFIVGLVYILIHKEYANKLYKNCINDKKIKKFTCLALFCFVLSAFNVVFADNSPSAQYFDWYGYIYFFLYVFLFGLFCVIAFVDSKEFMMTWSTVMVLQSIIILISLTSPALREFLYNYCYTGDDRMEKMMESGTRLMGIGIHSSMGSVVMASACIMLIYLKIRKNIPNTIFITYYLLIFAATLFVGRTGMLVELAALIAFFLVDKNIKRNLAILSVLSLVVVILVYMLLSSLDEVVAESLYSWFTMTSESGGLEGTVSGIARHGWPPLNPELLFGTGIYVGYNYNGILYDPDSGYIRMYMAIGVIGLVCHYLALYYLLSAPKYKYSKVMNRYFMIVLLIAYAIEYKEPYFWAYILPWAIFTIRLFDSNEKYLIKQNECEHRKVKMCNKRVFFNAEDRPNE